MVHGRRGARPIPPRRGSVKDDYGQNGRGGAPSAWVASWGGVSCMDCVEAKIEVGYGGIGSESRVRHSGHSPCCFRNGITSASLPSIRGISNSPQPDT